MARRPAARDVLVALAVGAELQAELLFVDAPQSDLVVARLALLARGYSNASIACERGADVDDDVARLLEKLGVRDRLQAVVLAYECRLA